MNIATPRTCLATLKLGAKQPGWTLDTQDDWRHDGALVGEKNTASLNTPLDQVDAFLPSNGAEVRGTAVMINGIMSDLALQRAELQALADTGLRVVGIHNSTKGMLRDFAQSVGDKLGLANNKAVDTAARVIGQAVKQREPLHIVGHSQGALVASRALEEVLEELQKEGLSQEQAEKALSPITVTSLGGSAWTYPEGPTYHHYYNDRDLVPLLTGRPIPAKVFDSSKETMHRFSRVSPSGELPPWKNGWVNRFARYVDATVHGARQVYLPRFKPQPEAESA